MEELGEHTEVESMGIGKNPMMKMKEQRDCKNPINFFLRRLESILGWLKQPSKK